MRPSSVFDYLEADGGWLTVPGIALAVGQGEETVRSQLRRLRKRGLVEWRCLELAHSGHGFGVDRRYEWRAV